MPLWFKEVLVGGLILAVSLVVAGAASFFIRLARTQIFLKRGRTLTDELLAASHWPVYYLIVACGLVLALKRLEETYPSRIASWIFKSLDGLFFIVAVGSVVYLLYRLAVAGILWYSNSVSARTQAKFDHQFVILFKRILKGVILFLAVLAILDHFQIDVKGLLAVAGISSLAFALAAQDTLSNMISGFILMADRPFRVGDRVHLAGGEGGVVIEIGLRSSRFLTDDGSILVVPNVELVRTRLTNQSAPDPKLRVTLKFLLPHDTPVEKAKNIFEKAVFATPGVLGEPAPAVLLSELNEAGLEYSAFFWVSGPEERGKVAEGVRIRALQMLREARLGLARKEILLKEEKRG